MIDFWYICFGVAAIIAVLVVLIYLFIIGIRLILYWFRRTDTYYWLYRHGAFRMSSAQKDEYEEIRKNIWEWRQVSSLEYIPDYLGDGKGYWVNVKDYKRFKKGEITVDELYKLALKKE